MEQVWACQSVSQVRVRVVSRSSAYSKRGETAQFLNFLPCLGLILIFVQHNILSLTSLHLGSLFYLMLCVRLHLWSTCGEPDSVQVHILNQRPSWWSLIEINGAVYVNSGPARRSPLYELSKRGPIRIFIKNGNNKSRRWSHGARYATVIPTPFRVMAAIRLSDDLRWGLFFYTMENID